MKNLLLVGLTAFCCLHVTSSWGQGQPPITVQLPTYSFFTVQTSVLVPDGGGAYLGGVSRAQSGSRYRGTPFPNRASGSSVQTGGMQVRATIIDNHEIDEQVLADGLAARGYGPEMTVEKLAAEQQRLQNERRPLHDTNGAASLAAIRQTQQAAESAENEQARQFFAKAQNYEQNDQLGLAKIFYRMAANHATGELQTDAKARLVLLERGHSAPAVAKKEY